MSDLRCHEMSNRDVRGQSQKSPTCVRVLVMSAGKMPTLSQESAQGPSSINHPDGHT